MRFTVSRDGRQRASVRVTHRADALTYCEALALTAHQDPSLDLAGIGVRQADELVRERFWQQGPPDEWTEYPDNELAPARAAALACFRRLYPSVKTALD